MARLTPEQLQEARRRSGKLGGRPAKPTVAEARADALERLVPKAIRVLEEHLESGRPDAWRSACRILEHSWGRPPEHVAFEPPAESELLDLEKGGWGDDIDWPSRIAALQKRTNQWLEVLADLRPRLVNELAQGF